DLALLAEGAHEPAGGRRAVDELLDSGVEFTAVLASNESSGRAALTRLQERGVSVPDEVALVGFDDFIEALATEPAMTSVRAPIDGVAREALGSLLERIREGSRSEPIRVVPTSLTLRESCGCVPAYDGEAAERARRTIAR